MTIRMLKLFISAAVIVFLLPSSHSSAADPKGKVSYLTPEDGGPDFLVQGEYQGTHGTGSNLGAHVIARGKGNFEVVLYEGGLPGAGWNKKTKTTMQATTGPDGVVSVTGEKFKGQIRDGVLTGNAEDGDLYRLYKIFRRSPTMGAPAPENALVLFNGENVDQWNGMKIEEDKLMGVGGRTKKKFKDFHLHLEFRSPFMPDHTGQARGNSGMYLGDQHECQILDSFGLEGLDNECGGIYQNARPNVNMCLPPLSWQTYDVDFTAAKFDDTGNKTKPAVVTIRHNGVVIHDNLEIEPTPGGGQNDGKAGALFLQNHGDPVRFRNIWIVEK
ncbi:MAG: DUF1080 domain-containing protein [Planctomycetaceae bacterium]|jgi:hypothetical protein|nr:DUF1080 domain-containing protein [Planctomycetaceae bacterium]MDB4786494.1 DUF1080 domain-containing protein [Planctomycetaceae bacterium]MDG2391589.1 DUF1080 domain-containing protein [Planctomycetaceae bacterium]